MSSVTIVDGRLAAAAATPASAASAAPRNIGAEGAPAESTKLPEPGNYGAAEPGEHGAAEPGEHGAAEPEPEPEARSDRAKRS